MKRYTNKELKDLFDANGIENTLIDNIEVDDIEDDDVAQLCEALKESLTDLYSLLESDNLSDFGDDDMIPNDEDD